MAKNGELFDAEDVHLEGLEQLRNGLKKTLPDIEKKIKALMKKRKKKSSEPLQKS